jgi:hypothetical protein
MIRRSLRINHDHLVRQMPFPENNNHPFNASGLPRNEDKPKIPVIEDRKPVHRTSRIEYRCQWHPRPFVIVEKMLVAARYLGIKQPHEPPVEAHLLPGWAVCDKNRTVGPAHDDLPGDLFSCSHTRRDVLLPIGSLPRHFGLEGRTQGLQRSHPRHLCIGSRRKADRSGTRHDREDHSEERTSAQPSRLKVVIDRATTKIFSLLLSVDVG